MKESAFIRIRYCKSSANPRQSHAPLPDSIKVIEGFRSIQFKHVIKSSSFVFLFLMLDKRTTVRESVAKSVNLERGGSFPLTVSR